MSIEEKKLRENMPDSGEARSLTPEEEMNMGQNEYHAVQILEDRIEKGEVEKKSVLDKSTNEYIGIQYIDKKTGDILFWEDAKKIDKMRRESMNQGSGMEEI